MIRSLPTKRVGRNCTCVQSYCTKVQYDGLSQILSGNREILTWIWQIPLSAGENLNWIRQILTRIWRIQSCFSEIQTSICRDRLSICRDRLRNWSIPARNRQLPIKKRPALENNCRILKRNFRFLRQASPQQKAISVENVVAGAGTTDQCRQPRIVCLQTVADHGPTPCVDRLVLYY